MADQFSLQGSYVVAPLAAPASADFGLASLLDEEVTLTEKLAMSMDLITDATMSVPFGGVAAATVTIIKVTCGGPLTATITTGTGLSATSRTVVVDSLLILLAASAPVTALSLARNPAVFSSVRVFLGQQS